MPTYLRTYYYKKLVETLTKPGDRTQTDKVKVPTVKRRSRTNPLRT